MFLTDIKRSRISLFSISPGLESSSSCPLPPRQKRPEPLFFRLCSVSSAVLFFPFFSSLSLPFRFLGQKEGTNHRPSLSGRRTNLLFFFLHFPPLGTFLFPLSQGRIISFSLLRCCFSPSLLLPVTICPFLPPPLFPFGLDGEFLAVFFSRGQGRFFLFPCASDSFLFFSC